MRLSRLLLGLMLLPPAGGTAEPPKGAPPGKRVDIGGRTLHLVCAGSGQPTVVFEAGGGRFSDRWSAVQGPVSARLTACSYDRAGLGWSDPPPGEPHTMENQVLDLHALLTAAKVPGPYILVGHSVGSLLIRLYSDRYPNEVVGVVMVEPTDESFRGYIKDSGPGRWVRIRDGLQPNELNPARAAFARELQAMHELRSKNPSPLGTRPLVVLIGGRKRPSPMADTPDDMWDTLQREDQELRLALAGLSRQSKAVVDPVSGHDLHVDDPQLVVLAIGEVADAVQHGKKLEEHGPTNILVETPRRLDE
jgi:pimeloyl-ACP methyl ester carboxylesterase